MVKSMNAFYIKCGSVRSVYSALWSGFTNLDNHWMDCHEVSDIHAPLRMNCNYFGDPLTFLPAPSSGHQFNLYNMLVHDQVFAKLMAFKSASVILCLVLISKLVKTKMIDIINVTHRCALNHQNPQLMYDVCCFVCLQL